VALRDIVAAACSAEWNWLGKTTKNNQLEVAATVVAKVAAAVLAMVTVAVVAWRQLPCNIVVAMCSAEWNWLGKKNKKQSTGGGSGSGGNGGSGGGGVAAAAVRHLHGSVQCRMELAGEKNNQPEVAAAVVAKVVVVVWRQLPCDIVTAACSAEWNWLKKNKKINQRWQWHDGRTEQEEKEEHHW